MTTHLPGSFPTTAIYGGPYREENRLPSGGWHVMANGRIFLLEVIGESGGDVRATLNSGEITRARWSVGERKLVCTRVVPGQIEQEWTGYLMAFSSKDPQWRIAGTFRNVRGLGPTSVPLTTGGWYATQMR